MAPPEPDSHSVLVKLLTILFLLWRTARSLVVHHKFVRDPVQNLPNVSACLDVAVRRIPEDWYKAPSSALLRLEVVAKFPELARPWPHPRRSLHWKLLRVVGPQSRGPHQKKQGSRLQTVPSAGLALVGHGPALYKTPRWSYLAFRWCFFSRPIIQKENRLCPCRCYTSREW